MNLEFRELKKWANNLGIKTLRLARWEIEELIIEAIEYRMDIGRSDSISSKQHRWYRSMVMDEVPQVDVPREVPREQPRSWRGRRRSVPLPDPKEEKEKCSFCDKDQDEVDWMITGPAAFICNECILLSVDMIKDARAKGRPKEESPSIYCGNLYRRKLRVRRDETEDP
jgi:hypothetical protein